ncbi:MAG: PD-(D/E)XK nuclease family transposase [Bacteroidetes bacterium]|nr:PD-(D/E)XK nuclease family transposase [Bacteroidota bacterium]MCB9042611.1 PD-(D/E)XK nuclease family transposase [Chitinophagales bacterium]
MAEFKEKYINPFTDYGFKRLFGEEPNKNLLLDFLNELLKKEEGTITNLTYLKNEKLEKLAVDKRAIFDLYCTNQKGENFIVELQKTKQKFFKDRTIYYSTFPIQEQAIKGSDWNFKLAKIYTIAILDFVFDEDKNQLNKFRYDVKLTEQETKKVFYDKLTFIYLEMPKFNKKVEELDTKFDKWLYVIKNLHKLDRIPENLRESIFLQLFNTAEISKFSREEYQNYEDSLKYYRDLKNSLETAREEKTIEIAKNGLKEGYPIEMISKMTGLSEQEIIELKDEL